MILGVFFLKGSEIIRLLAYYDVKLFLTKKEIVINKHKLLLPFQKTEKSTCANI